MSVILSYNNILVSLAVFNSADRRKVGQVVGTNDDTAGVDANLAVCILKLLGVFQD